ncbi:MAG: hypothetical protein OXC37_04910 [Bdellovibrionaceae bacterium]|nr:hypothetical protein [Pseudobdellovibrionaceae bacterium]
MRGKTSLSKAFEINNDLSVYGTFAEIGAGQETVNFFYKAGLASQTVAKSMSAYDMTVSDEIYGKQNRYVCKNRLINMLNHEYRLLEKRLKRKQGDKTCFFAFAVTAATSNKRKNKVDANDQHAWMGLRFQASPSGPLNDILFHVSCLDPSRLQQYEALGTLGVNLIYASFYRKKNPKEFISALIENLAVSRIEIHGMTCSGPAFNKFSDLALSLEVLSQNISPLAFFPNPKHGDFLSDLVFGKSIVILYDNQFLSKNFKKYKRNLLKALNLTDKKTDFIHFLFRRHFKSSQFKNYHFPLLIGAEQSLEELKKLLSGYTFKPCYFVIDESYFKSKLFNSKIYTSGYFLKILGELFDKKTKLVVLSQDKKFSVKNYKLKENQILKNYLIDRKQIVELSLN